MCASVRACVCVRARVCRGHTGFSHTSLHVTAAPWGLAPADDVIKPALNIHSAFSFRMCCQRITWGWCSSSCNSCGSFLPCSCSSGFLSVISHDVTHRSCWYDVLPDKRSELWWLCIISAFYWAVNGCGCFSQCMWRVPVCFSVISYSWFTRDHVNVCVYLVILREHFQLDKQKIMSYLCLYRIISSLMHYELLNALNPNPNPNWLIFKYINRTKPVVISYISSYRTALKLTLC